MSSPRRVRTVPPPPHNTGKPSYDCRRGSHLSLQPAYAESAEKAVRPEGRYLAIFSALRRGGGTGSAAVWDNGGGNRCAFRGEVCDRGGVVADPALPRAGWEGIDAVDGAGVIGEYRIDGGRWELRPFHTCVATFFPLRKNLSEQVP